MTWRNFKAYFDTHLWTSHPSWSWFTCSSCGRVRVRAEMLDFEDALYPQWFLLPDGSIRIGDA